MREDVTVNQRHNRISACDTLNIIVQVEVTYTLKTQRRHTL